MSLQSVGASIDNVCKKQKVSHRLTQKSFEAIIDSLTTIKHSLEDKNEDQGAQAELELGNLSATIEKKHLTQFQEKQKEYHSAINKLSKQIDKALQPDPDDPGVERFSKELVNICVAEHFYREGCFNLGEMFCKDVGVPFSQEMKEPFYRIFEVVSALKQKNLTPAIEWANAHSMFLQANRSDLLFSLHKLNFLNLVEEATGLDSLVETMHALKTAIAYAQKHLSPLHCLPHADVRPLFACLGFHRNLKQSPYASLFSPTRWVAIVHLFTKEACRAAGFTDLSPLKVCLAAGMKALPTISKMSVVMQGPTPWYELAQLPVEIDLGKEFIFHSVFACPVSREQTTAENPPMRLVCGHAVSKLSLEKLSRGGSARFKCPYCPREQHPSQALQLYF
eukprot:GCRY01002500.1.p1 GENE.GCRY01002500.1~~GCRY01002500.1.p1  ORF type:complete len:393 (+),score=84.81 GCRY01002500.1:195-1373(+)